MLYGQIIVLLIILLALYYAGMITMDILAANKAKASEEAKAEETEIDISGLAESFEPVEIKRIITKPMPEIPKDAPTKYKEPIMTNGYPVDNLLCKTNKAVDTGMDKDLADIVHRCESAA